MLKLKKNPTYLLKLTTYHAMTYELNCKMKFQYFYQFKYCIGTENKRK